MKRFFLKQTLFFTPDPLSPFWKSIYRYPYSQFVIRFLGSLTWRSLPAMLVSCPCFTLTNLNLFRQQQMLHLFSRCSGPLRRSSFAIFCKNLFFSRFWITTFWKKWRKKERFFPLIFADLAKIKVKVKFLLTWQKY